MIVVCSGTCVCINRLHPCHSCLSDLMRIEEEERCEERRWEYLSAHVDGHRKRIYFIWLIVDPNFSSKSWSDTVQTKSGNCHRLVLRVAHPHNQTAPFRIRCLCLEAVRDSHSVGEYLPHPGTSAASRTLRAAFIPSLAKPGLLTPLRSRLSRSHRRVDSNAQSMSPLSALYNTITILVAHASFAGEQSRNPSIAFEEFFQDFGLSEKTSVIVP